MDFQPTIEVGMYVRLMVTTEMQRRGIANERGYVTREGEHPGRYAVRLDSGRVVVASQSHMSPTRAPTQEDKEDGDGR